MEVVDLSVNDTNNEGLDGISNFEHVKMVNDSRDPSTDCDPLDGSPIRLVPPPSLSRQGPIPLGGVGVPNSTPLYGGTPPQRGSTVFLSDSFHSITKRKIANTAIRRKTSGGVRISRGC